MKDLVTYFKNVQIIHFDMIHHQCRGDPLKMPLSYYQMITKNYVNPFEEKPKKEFVSAAIRNQGQTKQPLFFKKDVVTEHFKQVVV